MAYELVCECAAHTLEKKSPYGVLDHAASFGGDGSGIYTREYRKVKTSKGLVAQIRNCNTMLGLKWFEDEELNVASYLNKTYYKFSE